ncbi:MAG TPA: protease inhibitor I42 family protein [Anaerolineae bacterium]|nr:protease inhibitor I42 family protein [Anaerolineae bacterium]
MNRITKSILVAVFIAAALIVILLKSTASIAFAHAEIDTCTPAINGTVATAPDKLTCTTTEALDPKGSSLSVFDAAGTSVDKGDSAVDLNDADRKTISVSLDTSKMKDGVYTVKWKTLSADDGDDADGSFTFTMGAAQTTAMAQGVDMAAAAKYCTDNGGTVTTRYPTYNTNAEQSQWLRLAGSRDFCVFYSEADSTGFKSQIEIALDTLYTDQPTLAVLAYLEPVSMPPFTGANPSTLYCNKLGGTDIWGGMNNAAGGGWVTDAPDSATNFQVVGMCVFPDMSAIDSWGLTYKANGVVRGTDLSKVIRYQPSALPNVFLSGSSQPAVSAVDKTLTKADNKSSVMLNVGDTLSIALDSNPSTGFSWQVAQDDKAVLAPLGDSQFALPAGTTPVPGAGGTQTFSFQAVGKGQTTLTLIYIRPWEKSVTPTPDDTFTVTVTVQ